MLINIKHLRDLKIINLENINLENKEENYICIIIQQKIKNIICYLIEV